MTKPINRELVELPGMPPKLSTLTPKQRRFVIGYLTHFNGHRAAIEAGYSARSADSIAYENLRKPQIIRYIQSVLRSYSITTDEVVAKLGQMARGQIPTKTIVKGGERTEYFEEQVALENMAKIHGLMIDRHTIERVDGLEIVDEDPQLLQAPDPPILYDQDDDQTSTID